MNKINEIIVCAYRITFFRAITGALEEQPGDNKYCSTQSVCDSVVYCVSLSNEHIMHYGHSI